jgi:hypothetical protein
MFYFNSQGTPIPIMNRRPRNLSGGGYVHGIPGDKYKHEDTIASVLEYGSLVIPTVVMESGIMDGYKGPLLGPKTKKKNELAPVVIMTGEMIVDKLHAPAVEKYLKKHGITLPLPK